MSEVFDEQGVAALLEGGDAASGAVSAPWLKDYDEYPGNRPTAWPGRFDMSRWVVLSAWLGTRRVGGAVVIIDDPQIDLLRDRPGCALLWDIRVAPDARGQGIGSALLDAAARSAADGGAGALRVETQQVNVPACRFYQHHGFRLERATAGAYPQLPGEVQLLWVKPLT